MKFQTATALCLVAASLMMSRAPAADEKPLTLNYQNPLWEGTLADPQAFKVGDTWYAIGTGPAPDGKQFPILRSKNFTDWEFVNGALESLKDPEFKDYWAPEIGERDGKFYLYYAADMRMRVAVIRTVPGKLIGPGHNSVILGPDGKTWFNIYHSWNPERSKRQICMDPLLWTDQGPQTFEPSRGRKSVKLPLAR